MTHQETPFVCLMYHNVCAAAAQNGVWSGFERLSPSITDYFIDARTFAAHCRSIAADRMLIRLEDLRGATLPEIAPRPQRTIDARTPSVMITFDDGWRGTMDTAGPILEACGLEGLMFVTTDLIGHPLFVDRFHLQALGPVFTVGSHGRSHRLLAELPDWEVLRELTGSKSALEDIIGRAVDAIAYPGGSYDRRVLRMTYDAGYRFVFTSRPVLNSTGQAVHRPIGRVAVKQSTTSDSLGRWLRGDLRRERVRSMGLQAMKRVLGPNLYRSLRRALMAERPTQLEMTDLAGAALPSESTSAH